MGLPRVVPKVAPPWKFPTKKWKGKTLFQVNALHDTGATMNLIAGELVSASQAVMTPEAYLRKVRTVHGEKVEQYEFLDLLVYDSNFRDITSSINDTRFLKNVNDGYLGSTNNPCGFLNQILNRFIRPFTNETFNILPQIKPNNVHLL